VTAGLTFGIALPIDVVFTWVDGADASWRASFDEWSTAIDSHLGVDARDPARYRDNDELRFSLRSIREHAPWIRRIHVVTAGQTPAWFRGGVPGISIVPHGEILRADEVPTFNSHAIESRLHHIHDLAEHFIYFNDDVFLARPQVPATYFDETGRACVAMTSSTLHLPGGPTAAACDRSALNGIRLIEQDLGSCPPLRPRHGPFPLRRSHLFDLEARFSSELVATAAHRFRDPTDVSLPSFLAPMHGLATGQVRRSTAQVMSINIDDADLAQQLRCLEAGTDVDAFCLNDTERADARAGRTTAAFLRRRFPDSAPWETDDPGQATKPFIDATSSPSCRTVTRVGPSRL